MYRIAIAGRTVKELRDNVTKFLAETSVEEIIEKQTSQPTFNTKADTADVMTIIAHHAAAKFIEDTPTPSPVEPIITSGEVDSRGIPWDARIHAATKVVTTKGAWRTRRGVEPALVKQIESELRTAVAGRQTTPVAVPPPPVAQAPIPLMGLVPPPVTVAPTPIATPPPATAPVSIAPVISAHTFDTFKNNLVATLTRLVSEGKLTQEYIQLLRNHFNVEQIWQVNDAQIAEMFEQFANAGLIARA